MITTPREKLRITAIGSFTASITLLWFCFYLPDTFWLGIFQARDLYRMELIASGVPIFYGPELTGGGNSPGPFYYLMYIIPFELGGIEGVYFFHHVYFSIAITFISLFCYKRWGAIASGTIYILLASSYFFKREIFLNYNPSAKPIFLSILTILLFKLKDDWKQQTWSAFCFVLNIASQVHVSLLLFYFFGFFLSRKEKIKFVFKGFLVGMVAFLPYVTGSIYCSLISYKYCPNPTTDSGDAFLFSFSHLGQSFYSIERIFSTLSTEFIWFFTNDFTLTFCTTLFMVALFLKRRRLKRDNGDLVLVGSMVVLFSIAFMWFAKKPVHTRYLIPFAFSLFLFLAIGLERVSYPRCLNIKWLGVIFTVLVTTSYTYITINKKFNKITVSEISFNYKLLKEVLGKAYRLTGWSFEKFRMRTFITTPIPETEIELIYKDLDLPKINDKTPRLDSKGILISLTKEEKEVAKKIPPEFKALYKKDLLEINMLSSVEDFSIFSYKVKGSYVPKFFHSIRYHYILPDRIEKLERYYQSGKRKEVTQLSENKWRICWDCEPRNWKNIDIEIKRKGEYQIVNLKLNSPALNMPTAVKPKRLEHLKDLRVEYLCKDKEGGGKKRYTYGPWDIGELSQYSGSIERHIISPFEITSKLSCDGIKEIKLGYEGQYIRSYKEEWKGSPPKYKKGKSSIVTIRP